jgi:nicotinate-nucleotide--dimethylbenzimidazole phosphoribosyltransferase
MLLEETLERIRRPDRSCEVEAQKRLDSLTKPQDSLGKLEDLARRVSLIQGKVPPQLGRKLLFVFAADHGITEEGVSAYPKAVTAQMTYNFLRGGAAINVLARHSGVDVEVIDVGVDHEFSNAPGLRNCKVRRGTNNFSRGPAMSRPQAVQSIEIGIGLVKEATAENLFLLGAGEMGIGNTSSAAALLCGLTGAQSQKVVGKGTGIDDATWKRKMAAIQRGLEVNRTDPNDPLDVLAKVGGLEIGAMAGTILGAAAFHIPIVLDGFISGAAALLAQRLCPDVHDFLFASHLSTETGHGALLEALELPPVLDLAMRLGEGTGACLLMSLIEAAVKILGEMATFDSAGVEKKLP